MLDYLAESILVSFIVGTMLGAFLAMQLGSAKIFKSYSQRPEHRK